MASGNTAFVITNSGFGNIGQAPPNAVIYGDMIVKNDQDQVIYSQPSGCTAEIQVSDNRALIEAKLTASARQTMKDDTLAVVFL